MEVMMSWRRLLSCSQWHEHSVALPALKSKICKVSNINFKALWEILGPSCDEFYAYLFLGGIPVMGGHPGKYVTGYQQNLTQKINSLMAEDFDKTFLERVKKSAMNNKEYQEELQRIPQTDRGKLSFGKD